MPNFGRVKSFFFNWECSNPDSKQGRTTAIEKRPIVEVEDAPSKEIDCKKVKSGSSLKEEKLECTHKRVLAAVQNAPSYGARTAKKLYPNETFSSRFGLSQNCMVGAYFQKAKSDNAKTFVYKDAPKPDRNNQKASAKAPLKMIFMQRDIDLNGVHGWNFVAGDEILGEGTYGRVYKMYNLHSEEVRAFKRTFIDGHGRGFPSWLMREISILDSLSHPNIIRLLQVFIGPERVYLSFPYINGGNVMELLQSRYERGMPVFLSKTIVRQLLQAVAHCHENRVIHRDLKPENLLCTVDAEKSSIHIILADFGLARSVRWPNQSLSPEVITLNYRPIELLLGMPHYTSAVDIWSTGCILVELLVGPRAFREMFFGSDNLNEFSLTMRLILKFGYPTKAEWPSFHDLPFASSILPRVVPDRSLFAEVQDLRKDLDSNFFDLLRKILILNPDNRITAEQALKHEWFNDG